MKYLKLYSVFICAMILIVTLSVIPVYGDDVNDTRLPAQRKGPPEFYDRYEAPRTFEDMFFSRNYRESAFNFTVPHYLNNTYIGSVFRWAEEDRLNGGHYCHITLVDDKGKFWSNTSHYAGGGTSNEPLKAEWVNFQVNTSGSTEFMLIERMEWDDLFNKKQYIEFTGAARTYNLFGMGGWVEGFDEEQQFIRVHLESDKPLRYYIFEDDRWQVLSDIGRLVDYEETPTTKTYLDIRNDKRPGWLVGSFPFLTLSNPGDPNETVNVEFHLEVLDYKSFNIPVILAVGAIFGVIIGGLIWKYKKVNRS